jgi:hypothetical protein
MATTYFGLAVPMADLAHEILTLNPFLYPVVNAPVHPFQYFLLSYVLT